MQLHNIQPNHKGKSRKRVGRGGKRGTYSGRGVKGQGSRSGRKFQPPIRELIKRFPKLRGYRNKLKTQPVVGVNLAVLEKKLKEGNMVSPENLLKLKIIRKIEGKTPKVKILGKGELTESLVFENVKMSKGVKLKAKS